MGLSPATPKNPTCNHFPALRNSACCGTGCVRTADQDSAYIYVCVCVCVCVGVRVSVHLTLSLCVAAACCTHSFSAFDIAQQQADIDHTCNLQPATCYLLPSARYHLPAYLQPATCNCCILCGDATADSLPLPLLLLLLLLPRLSVGDVLALKDLSHPHPPHCTSIYLIYAYVHIVRVNCYCLATFLVLLQDLLLLQSNFPLHTFLLRPLLAGLRLLLLFLPLGVSVAVFGFFRNSCLCFYSHTQTLKGRRCICARTCPGCRPGPSQVLPVAFCLLRDLQATPSNHPLAPASLSSFGHLYRILARIVPRVCVSTLQRAKVQSCNCRVPRQFSVLWLSTISLAF